MVGVSKALGYLPNLRNSTLWSAGTQNEGTWEQLKMGFWFQDPLTTVTATTHQVLFRCSRA